MDDREPEGMSMMMMGRTVAATDTWQGTAWVLRKQPPRDAQQGGVRGPKETRTWPPLFPSLACVPIRAPAATHQNPQQQEPYYTLPRAKRFPVSARSTRSRSPAAERAGAAASENPAS
jgi:hypothetical protein